MVTADMAANGEIRVNQAKRGYDVTTDEQGLICYNPYVYADHRRGMRDPRDTWYTDLPFQILHALRPR